MALPKVLLFSRNADEARALLPLARALYYSGTVEGMAIIDSAGEWDVEANPLIHRFYEEFSRTAPPDLYRAGIRAILEERAEVAVFPNTDPPFDRLLDFCWELEGVRTLVWPDRPVDVQWERFLKPPPTALGVLTLDEAEWAREPLEDLPPTRRPALLTDLQELQRWICTETGPAPRVAVVPRLHPLDLVTPHLPEVARLLPEGPCLLVGETRAREALQALAPQARFEEGLDRYAAIVNLLGHHEQADVHLVPVNLQVEPDGPTWRHGDYDNEFARGPASHDLSGYSHVRVLGGRGGGRPDLWTHRDLPHPEAPDGAVPMFLAHRGTPPHWLDRFRLPDDERLNVVFVDSQNIAGSVLNHAVAVNRHTRHRATALCRTRHPYIGYPDHESRAVYLDQGPPDEKLLQEADCFVFFEDDDEATLGLERYVEGKRVVHLYIGQRVHKDVARHQREGRTVLTPLPHLIRMFPGAHFYAGFPPVTLEDVPLRQPRSQADGVVRLLHTPSLPHPTLSRFYYHKDTEAFLHAARETGRRTGVRVEPWQVAGWPHREVMEARLECDVTFNQLRGYHGLSGDEAMFLGRPVVQAFDQFNINRHREYWGLDVEFPWISTTPDRLSEVLVELVESPERREALGVKSRQFMLDYFSPKVGILPLLWYCARAPRL